MPPRVGEPRFAPTAVDIFAGGGGLTVGLKRGGFKVVAAVEIDPHAFATYKANHPEVSAFKQDVRTVDGESLRRLSPTGEIDLLAGCPPCQGFSTLTAKYRRSDPRNDLVIEMLRLIEQIQPRMVMMENVPGLAKKGRPIFQQFLERLSELGYECNWDILEVADYGVPQTRRRLVLLAGRGFSIPIPAPTHSRNGKAGLQPWRTLRSVIEGLPEPVTLRESRALGGPKAVNWHVVRDLSQQNIERLKQMQPGMGRTQIPKELRPKCHQNLEKGFINVYGRMTWDQTPVTITSGCTTLSKGRFGHPDQLRTISVREAALIQTFPWDYVIDTEYIEKACMIIGNALPCDFAEVLARQCYNFLIRREEKNCTYAQVTSKPSTS